MVMDKDCQGHLNIDLIPIDLSMFNCINNLSWSSFGLEGNLDSACKLLNMVATQLEQLELDFNNWEQVPDRFNMMMAIDDVSRLDDDESQRAINRSFLARRILSLSSTRTNPVFPALQVLSLAEVGLEEAPSALALAFDFSTLRSLKIRHCPGWEVFLQQIVNSTQIIALKSLEIKSYIEDKARNRESGTVIAEFLEAFQGLENLFISTSDDLEPETTTDPLIVWRSATRHESTLSRFVHQLRTSTGRFRQGDFHDQPQLWLTDEDFSEIWRDPSEHPFNRSSLEFVGLCCMPPYLVCISSLKKAILCTKVAQMTILRPFTQKQTLKVVHIRQSGLDRDTSWGIWRTFDATASNSDSDDFDDEMEDDDEEEEEEEEGKWVYEALELEPHQDRPLSHSQLIRDWQRECGVDLAYKPRPTQDLHFFANWAFGPTGIPSLSVIAFGDFSYNERYASENVFLCRNEHQDDRSTGAHQRYNYRQITSSDHSAWDLIEIHRYALEACPTNSLFSARPFDN
jgi:hypothetical protein